MDTDQRFHARLTDFLNRLREAKIHFTLASFRDDTVMVQVTVPGERWEIEFFTDGHVEAEKFRSSGEIFDATALETLFTQFGE